MCFWGVLLFFCWVNFVVVGFVSFSFLLLCLFCFVLFCVWLDSFGLFVVVVFGFFFLLSFFFVFFFGGIPNQLTIFTRYYNIQVIINIESKTRGV